MFMGEYQHSVDAKGRLIIPSKYREQLGDKMVVTKGFDTCLYLYPMEEWEKMVEKFAGLNLLKESERKFKRQFIAGASECEFDKQGRILLPASLRTHVGIDKDVVLAGMMERIEIWDKDRWEQATNIDDMNEIAEMMAERGLSL